MSDLDADARSRIYGALWSASDAKPYDEAREAEVTQRRFAAALPYIQRRADLVRPQARRLRVLDFGCADGHTAEQILASLVDEVLYLGADLYPLDRTAQRMRARGFEAEVHSGSLASIPGDWRDLDVVLALSCFQYIPDTEATLTALAQRLAPGGVFVGYFYDAAPLRRVTDAHLRSLFDSRAADPNEAIEALRPLAELMASLREATREASITINEPVAELGIPATTMPLQQFIIDHLIFAWAPEGAGRTRIQWALAEMLLTGQQVYLSPAELAPLLDASGLQVREVISRPSGHLIIAERS
jgi:SAM-dependent methyltransferase